MTHSHHWARPIISIIRGAVPLRIRVLDVKEEGLYLTRDLSLNVRMAFLAKDYVEQRGEEGVFWIPSKDDRECGVQFAEVGDEDDLFCWALYDHNR